MDKVIVAMILWTKIKRLAHILRESLEKLSE
jgi:hypothetical protein